MSLQTIVVLFGFMNLIMGIQAYLSTKSIPSLLAGGGIGIIILLSTFFKSNPIIMYIVASLCSLLLLGKFFPAYIHNTQKIYPNLIIIVASIFVLINIIFFLFTKKELS